MILSNPGKPRALKILQLINGEYFGGAERIQEKLIKSINKDKFEVSYASLLSGNFTNRLRQENVQGYSVHMKNRLDISVIPRLAGIIRKENIDIIHTHSIRTNVVGRLVGLFTGKPVITHVHSFITEETRNQFKNELNWVLERMTRRLSDKFITVTVSLKRELIENGVPAKKITTIPNGISLEKQPAGKKTGGIKELKRLIEEEPLEKLNKIASVGNFRWAKGTEYLIRAVEKLKRKQSGDLKKDNLLKCILIGNFQDIEYKRKILQEINNRGLEDFIVFAGYVENVEDWLSAVDLLVIPSITEGLPLVALEAMRAGTPIVATQVGGLPDLLTNGETGILVPPKNADKLAEGIDKLLNNDSLAARIAARARKELENKYTAKSMIASIEELYLDFT